MLAAIAKDDGLVFITGGSSGLGRALAIHFSELGFAVHIVGRDEDRLKETLSQLEVNKEHKYFVCDLSSPQ